MSDANDWWTSSQSTSSSFLNTPTRQPTTSGAVRPLFGSTSTPAHFPAAHTPGAQPHHTPGSSLAQSHVQNEYIDELDEADAKLADSVNFGPVAPAGAGTGTARSSHGHGYGYGASPGRSGMGSSMGYTIGTPGQAGPSSPGPAGGYASSPLAGIAGIGSPGGKRSPGSRFGGMESGSSPRDQRRRTMPAAYQDEDLPPTASLRDIPGGGNGDQARIARPSYNSDNQQTPSGSSYNADPSPSSRSPDSQQVQDYRQPDWQIGQAINIIDRNVLRAAPAPAPSGWLSFWPFGSAAVSGSATGGSVGQQGVGAVGTGVGAGAGPGGGPGGSMVWQENKSTAGWVLGKLIGS